ncbi:MAG: S41 family peptidase [Isosphaeraceae bacterium]
MRLDHWPKAGELAPGRLDELSKLRVDFRHRLRLCETHYRLGRRYQDQSFRKTLLAMPREQALSLYDEVLERIETQYVEPIVLDQLLRRGLDNMEVALRDPGFLQANAPGATPDRTIRLREAYRGIRDRVTARDRNEARAQVAAACDLGREGVGLPASAVVLEFVFGATDALNDDYSSYLTPDKLDDLYAMIDGNFVGLGVELKQDEKGLRLVAVIPGGPAAEAGLKMGDKIIEVNGQSVAGVGLDDAAGRLQGSEGTAVEIGVLHPDGQTQRYRLVRRPVEVKSVAQAKMVDGPNGVGYIQLTGFQKSTTDELTRAIAALQRQGLRHLILDLRGNPGGLLNIAVELAERFVDKGVVNFRRVAGPPARASSTGRRARPSGRCR